MGNFLSNQKKKHDYNGGIFPNILKEMLLIWQPNIVKIGKGSQTTNYMYLKRKHTN